MLRKTALHACHLDLGAKMGEFAGYDMPLYYREGVIHEHQWVRSHAGVFDVSHMGQVILTGPDITHYLETVTPSSFAGKPPGRAQYTVLTNEQGGIVDDIIVTKLGEDEYFIVLNAGRKAEDIQWLKAGLSLSQKLYHMESQSLIALQGRWAERIIYEVFEYDATSMPYMSLQSARTRYGVPVYISRLGYTGEDGFEISIPDEAAADVFMEMADHAEATPAGLAARDTLRLEMGYPLYGHDIDETTTPIEAGIGWIVGKANTGFKGANVILKQKRDGTARQRAGFRLTDKGVAREGAEFRDGSDRIVGRVTSGGYSPTLKQSIGMGYIEAPHVKPGQEIFVNVRGKNLKAEIAAMPFVEPRTKSIKKQAAA